MKYPTAAMTLLAAAALAACSTEPPKTYLSTFITTPGVTGVTRVASTSDCVVYFDVNSAAIRDDQKGTVERCAKFLADHPESRLQLAGYADERGTEGYNLKLGEQRAEAVQQALADRGLPKERTVVASYGEERAAGEGESAWSRSRRVEFAAFTAPEASKK
ncbi:MAG TPA: OmpA family protein [Solimonas sp.]|nr:OmpA family protein [Solimonas sp.]